MSLPHLAAPSNSPEALFMAMSTAFAQYSDWVDNSSSIDSITARAQQQQLESQWHSIPGLCGRNALQLLKLFRQQIAWETMQHNFPKFYQFVFHVCKAAPHGRYLQIDVALEAWRLLLTHRFRLLDKWCTFIAEHSPPLKLVSLDQWRQVLDFSQTVHENLSNYDPHGAWPCLIDEFVDNLRLQRQGSRAMLSPDDDFDGLVSTPLSMVVSPRCGSKRRSPDVDVVVERLSAIPLPSSQPDAALAYALSSLPAQQLTQPGSATKRHCVEAYRQQDIAQHQLMDQQPALLTSPQSGPHSGFMFELPMLQVQGRRHLRPRRSNVSELVNHTVSESLFSTD